MHSAFVEIEFSTNTETKTHGPNAKHTTICPCRLEKIDSLTSSLLALQKNKNAKFTSAVLSTLSFCTVTNFLLPVVTPQVRLYRSPNNTLLHLKGTDEEAKNLDGKILPVVEKVNLSIERNLLKSEAVYPQFESLNKSFIIQTGRNCFIK